MKKYLQIVGAFLLGVVMVAPFAFPDLASAGRTGVQTVGGYFAATAQGLSNVYYNSGSVGIGTSAPTSNGLSVVGLSSTTQADVLKVASSSGSVFLSVGYNGTTSITNFIGTGIPTLATGTGLATNDHAQAVATLTTGSTDIAGQINLTTGSAPAGNSIIVTTTFGSSTMNFCTIAPSNNYAGTTTSIWINTASTTNFSIMSGTSTLLATTSYKWNYHCN